MKIRILSTLMLISGSAFAQSPESWKAPGGADASQSPGAMYQRNGSSLLRATISSQSDPARSPLRSVSVFAVEEPVPKTLRKHDLVTVIIREESTSSSKGNTDLKKDEAVNMALQQFVKLNLGNFALQGGAQGATPPALQWTNHRDLKGQASIDRADTTLARIEGEVVDVKPNGTLVLQAHKRIRNDDEEKEILLSGICMASDVGPDGSILSSQLHDLDLNIKTSGAVRDTTRRGWLPKLLDVINPF